MSTKPAFLRASILCALLIALGAWTDLHANHRGRHKKKSPPASVETSDGDDDSGPAGPAVVRLKLKDGTRITVDEAWESEQGFWYRQGGLTHLVTRDRVAAIERTTAPAPKAEPQIARVTQVNQTQTSPEDGPAWIYLVGGARVEADSASESASGVWYRWGSLSIFIDRARVDHIERETDKIAQADKKDRGWSTGSPKLDNLIRQNGVRHGVDPYLVFLVMEQESHFNPRVVSPKGARGLMQLMPGTGARFGVRRPFDPAQNISGGTRYLRQLLDRFNGRVDLVLASYNAGEGAVIKFGHRVPPYRETRNYVKKISYRYKRKIPVGHTTSTSSTSAGGN